MSSIFAGNPVIEADEHSEIGNSPASPAQEEERKIQTVGWTKTK